MTKKLYAKVVDGDIVAQQPKDLDNQAIGVGKDGHPIWRPVIVDNPAHDPLTQTKTGPNMVIESAQVVRRFTVVDSPLADVKANLNRRLDEDAENVRLKYMTPGDGMIITYQEKASEAKAVKDDASPDLSNYPILSASVGVEGDTLEDVADLVLSKRAQWQHLAKVIETTRLRGKKAIGEAGNNQAALDAYNAVKWTV